MATQIAEEMLNLSAKLMLRPDKAEVLQISARLNSLAADYIRKSAPPQGTTTGDLRLTKQEIAKMPKVLRKEFITEGCVAHVIKRPSGKKTYCYEIRYRRNGLNVSASSTDPAVAKQKFIEKLKESLQNGSQQKKSATLFENIAEEWFAHKKPQLVEGTYKSYYSYYIRCIRPKLNGMPIDKIHTSDLDDIMKCVVGKGRAYEDIRSILNQVFVYAEHNGLIKHNPVKLVPFIKADREHGDAISIEEELTLLNQLNDPKNAKYRQSFLAMLFFGLRPCELSNTRFENGMMIAQNRKRKNGKIEYKKIPLSPTARRFYDTTKPCKATCCDNQLRKILAKLLPNRKLYDLRHTFSSRCQMFVRQEIVEIWLGDSPERLIGSTYTHFPDSFMIAEMQKVDYLP